MKIRKNQIIFAIFSFLGVHFLLAGYLSVTETVDIKTEKEKEIVFSPFLQTKPQIEPKALSGEEGEVNVFLNVLEKEYQIQTKENSSVFEVMKVLQEREADFSFSYKEYSGLGVFVDEINGLKGKNGKYWLYYINNEEASVGVSSYFLKEGDIISWRLK
jgi:hypothetical protein